MTHVTVWFFELAYYGQIKWWWW